MLFETRRRRILEACEKHWSAYKEDCSGFVKKVYAEIGASAHLPDCQANALYEHFKQTKKDWFHAGDGSGAVSLVGSCAHEGNLVIAAWQNPLGEKTCTSKDGHNGHLAIVSEYMSTAKAAKPEHRLLSYWGKLGDEGAKGEKITLSFGSDKLKTLSYFVYQGRFDQKA